MASTANRREAIIAAAAQAFDAHGYAATTIEQVAANAGISKGNIYNYFHSKEELFEQVFVSVVADMETDALQIFKEPFSAADKLKRLIDYRCSTMEQSQLIGRLVLEFWATAAREQRGQLATTLRQMYDRWHEQVAAVVVQGIDRGEFRPEVNPALAAVVIVALLDGIEVQSLLGFGPELDQNYRSTLEKAVMAALLAEKEN